MNIDNLNDKLKRIISDQFNCDASELSDSTGPGDIPQWDSIGKIFRSGVDIGFNICDKRFMCGI